MQPDTAHPEPPAANRREIFARLCGELPPPVPDTPDLRAARDQDAMDAVVALHPADAFEARLAVRIVAMDSHAGDCLRSAGLVGDDPEKVRRCRAQAASMARQSDAALRSLQRMQATRDKQLAEQHPAAMERAGYWFKEIVPPDPAPPPFFFFFFKKKKKKKKKKKNPPPPHRAERIRAAGGLPARLDFGAPKPEIVARLLKANRPKAEFLMPHDIVA